MTEPSISQRIKTTRLRLGLSLGDLATRTGLSKSYLHDLETGKKTNPGTGTIAALCRAFGVSADWLVGLAPESSEEPEATIARLREEIRELEEWRREVLTWHSQSESFLNRR